MTPRDALRIGQPWHALGLGIGVMALAVSYGHPGLPAEAKDRLAGFLFGVSFVFLIYAIVRQARFIRRSGN